MLRAAALTFPLPGSPRVVAMSTFRQAAAPVAVLAFVAAAAASPAGGQASPKHVQVTLTEYRIQLSRSVVPRGRVTFQVTNRGSITHDFAFATGRGTRSLGPGQRQTFRVTFAKAGIHRYRSRIPGHAALGMQGALRVGKGAAPPLRSGTTAAPFALTPIAEGLGSR
jgi:plastocyanin